MSCSTPTGGDGGRTRKGNNKKRKKVHRNKRGLTPTLTPGPSSSSSSSDVQGSSSLNFEVFSVEEEVESERGEVLNWSPRRSSRLLQKKKDECFMVAVAPLVESGPAAASEGGREISGYGIFQQTVKNEEDDRGMNLSIDSTTNTSDYGTLSVCSSSDIRSSRRRIVLSDISDDISNMSLEDNPPPAFVPYHQEEGGETVAEKTGGDRGGVSLWDVKLKNVEALMDNGSYFLLPKYVNFDCPVVVPKLFCSEELTLSAVEWFARRDTIIFPACNVFRVSLCDGCDGDMFPDNRVLTDKPVPADKPLFPPDNPVYPDKPGLVNNNNEILLVKELSTVRSDWVEVWKKEEEYDGWRKLYTRECGYQKYLWMTFQPGIEYLVTAKLCLDKPTRVCGGLISPDKGLELRIFKSPRVSISYPPDAVDSLTRTQGEVFFSRFDLPDISSGGAGLPLPGGPGSTLPGGPPPTTKTDEEEHDEYPLGGPILCLKPHGLKFKNDVEIRIEILDYGKIVEMFKDAKLLVFESEDGRKWIPLEKFHIVKSTSATTTTSTKSTSTKPSTTLVVSVRHFSFFKVVWDLLSSSLTSARLGLSTLLSTCVAMKCQATMDEYENDRFGLEISVYGADKALPEVQNYSHVVGKSLSKLVRPGKLTVGLKSCLFEADVDAGEQVEMTKEEDFKGQDFCKDYALKFNSSVKIERGPIGKVLVKRYMHNRSNKDAETIFEFNIQKQGNENETNSEVFDGGGGNGCGGGGGNNEWSVLALQELATSLYVTEHDNWKRFATRIGFTKKEIKIKFQGSPDPFRSIIEAYRARGGTPEEFIKSLYEISREINLSGGGGGGSCPSPSSSLKSMRSSKKTSDIGSSISANNYNKRGMVVGTRSGAVVVPASDDDDAGGFIKRNRNKRMKVVVNSRNVRKRRKYSDFTESFTSPSDDADEEAEEEDESSSSEGELPPPRVKKSSEQLPPRTKKTSMHSSNKSAEAYRRDQTVLENGFFWELSHSLTNNTWKALGRTLHLEEANLVNISQSHLSQGNRECYYQVLLAWKEHFPKQCTYGNLYSALIKENLNLVAKKMANIQANFKS